ncbi:MAG: antibiotic biosynthesis monooxygenase [Acidobacteriaceae bacterium]
MIARHWRGWTVPKNADAYQELLSGTVLPGLKKISGYRGGYVLRRDVAEEVEFVVVNLFDSIEAVQQFAGTDFAVAQFEPEARLLLARVEPLASHYEVCVSTVPA